MNKLNEMIRNNIMFNEIELLKSRSIIFRKLEKSTTRPVTNAFICVCLFVLD